MESISLTQRVLAWIRNWKRPDYNFWTMFSFVALPITIVATVIFILCLYSDRERNITGVVMAAGIGIVFLLIAAFSFSEKYLTTDKNAEATDAVSFYCKWLSSCTFFMLIMVLASWFLCNVPEVSNEGMIFTHPQAIGKIFNYVNQHPDIYSAFGEDELNLFEKQIKLFSKGIFSPELAGGVESVDDDNVNVGTLVAIIAGMPFFIAFGFSVIGAVIWALMDVLDRLREEKELLPRHYLSYMLRCVMAPFIAIVIAFYLSSNWPYNAAPAIFFFVGFFPKKGIRFFTDVGENLLKSPGKGQKNNKPPGVELS